MLTHSTSAGLVGITPAAGYVSPWLAAVIGLITGMVCSSLENLNEWIRIDEGLDVFKLHGIGGMVGCFLTGIFATNTVSMVDGTEAPGGIDGNGIQIGYQLASICAITAYSFAVSCVLLLIMKYIPGLHLRVSEEVEMNGLDGDHFFEEQIGEWAEFERHIKSTGPSTTPTIHGVRNGAASSSEDGTAVGDSPAVSKEARDV